MPVLVFVSLGCLGGILVATTACLLLGIWNALEAIHAAIEDHTRMVKEREWLTHAGMPAPPLPPPE
jgi:hypothetical protein